MKRVLFPLLLILAFIALAVVGVRTQHPKETRAIACVDPVQGCVFTHRGIPAQLRFSRLPTPMQPFSVEVRVSGVMHASAEVQMVGMDMGFNRYALQTVGPNVFVAHITLPVCVSGRRDWKFYLEVDSDHYVIPFNSQ